MQTLNYDTFSAIARFLTKPDGEQLVGVSKSVSAMVIANKDVFKTPTFFKKNGKFFLNFKNKIYELKSERLVFNSHDVRDRNGTLRTAYNMKNMFLDEEGGCAWIFFNFKTYETYFILKTAYDEYIQQINRREEYAKAIAEYKRKHPVVALKQPSKPAPWAKSSKL